MALLSLLLLLIGFASQGGRATVTYQPTRLQGDGQGCPSDENKAQVIENFHNLIEDIIEIESTPEGRLLTKLNTAVETLNQEVADLVNTSQTVNGTLAELRQEVSDLSSTTLTNVLQVLINEPGLTQALPATSCRQIFKNRPDLPSGYYWIRSSNETAVQLFCDMARQCCDEITGGWTRVAYLDMTDPNQQCPPEWREIPSPKRTCARIVSGGCDSATFPVNGISYSRVCGRILAYQCGHTDGLNTPSPIKFDIERHYIDGVSITHGSPRQHIWTFAAATSEPTANSQCACSTGGVNHAVAGNDYFCGSSSGQTSAPDCNNGTGLITTNPLWDGEGCSPSTSCCEFNNPPWFCNELPQPTTDDIEVRICANGGASTENTPIEQLEIYVS